MTFRDMRQDAQLANLQAEQRAADGATTDVLSSLVAQVTQLKQEVARQNIALTVLTQALLERGGVDGAALKARFDQAMGELQAQANLVVCGRCRKRVDRRYTQIGATGTFCDACHQVMNADE